MSFKTEHPYVPEPVSDRDLQCVTLCASPSIVSVSACRCFLCSMQVSPLSADELLDPGPS